MGWPDDEDGDVLRRMEENGFNFDNEVEIDFNIDFDHWPLNEDEKAFVLQQYPSAVFVDPDEEDMKDGLDIGYVQLQVRDRVTYELVVSTQQKLGKEMEKIGGWCESWGVWQD